MSYSILAERFDEDAQLQVAFCRSTNCTMDDLSTVRRKIYHFERPFYRGRRTRWSGEITAVPALSEPSECVDRCFTFGCVEPDNATGITAVAMAPINAKSQARRRPPMSATEARRPAQNAPLTPTNAPSGVAPT